MYSPLRVATRGPALSSNARFPLGPSTLAFAQNSSGSILNNTGPALRDFTGQWQQGRDDHVGAPAPAGNRSGRYTALPNRSAKISLMIKG